MQKNDFLSLLSVQAFCLARVQEWGKLKLQALKYSGYKKT